MASSYYLLICTAVMLSLFYATNAAKLGQNARTDWRTRTRRNIKRTDPQAEDPDYWRDWPCPQVRCAPIGECVRVEVVAWVHGPRHCRGCPFCLDRRPDPLSSERGRRSVTQDDVCPEVHCPMPRPEVTCTRAGLLDGYVRGTICISCSFCVDNPAIQADAPRLFNRR